MSSAAIEVHGSVQVFPMATIGNSFSDIYVSSTYSWYLTVNFFPLIYFPLLQIMVYHSQVNEQDYMF